MEASSSHREDWRAMKFVLVLPEVAGELGPGTEMDRSTHPPIVAKLHFIFDDWEGDGLVTTFPCYLVTAEVKQILDKLGATGCEFRTLDVSTSDVFYTLHGSRSLPRFFWLHVNGMAGHDELGLATGNRLVVSRKVIDVLVERGLLPHARFEPWIDEQ